LVAEKKEAIAFTTLALISWQLPVQSILLQQRVLVQAVYRQFTNQVPTAQKPPVLLVEIDDESIKEARIANPTPIDRSYLAKLVDKLSSQNAKVIGFDYVLDRYQQETIKNLPNLCVMLCKKTGLGLCWHRCSVIKVSG
jgi:CHASE2 domain-containing sensor protein